MTARSIDPESISSKLDWREFESFAEKAFVSFGFDTNRNRRFTKPRMEIDLVAVMGVLAFSVDCKHWKRTVGHASMLNVGERQIARSRRLLELGTIDRVIPVILTLHDEMLHILEDGVAIVPVHKLSDFIMNWESSRDHLLVLKGKLQANLS